MHPNKPVRSLKKLNQTIATDTQNITNYVDFAKRTHNKRISVKRLSETNLLLHLVQYTVLLIRLFPTSGLLTVEVNQLIGIFTCLTHAVAKTMRAM